MPGFRGFPESLSFCVIEGLTKDPALEMDPDAEEPDTNESCLLWSGSDGSWERCVSESLADSSYEDDASDAERRSDPRPAGVQAQEKTPELYQGEEWKSAGEPGLNGSEAEVSYHGEDEEDHVSPQRPDSHPEVSLALTPTRGQAQNASSRRRPGTPTTGVDSSEEGGSREAPPASVSFGMSDAGAEQAEAWSWESDTDLCRPDRQRLPSTCKYLSSASLRAQQAASLSRSLSRA